MFGRKCWFHIELKKWINVCESPFIKFRKLTIWSPSLSFHTARYDKLIKYDTVVHLSNNKAPMTRFESARLSKKRISCRTIWSDFHFLHPIYTASWTTFRDVGQVKNCTRVINKRYTFSYNWSNEIMVFVLFPSRFINSRKKSHIIHHKYIINILVIYYCYINHLWSIHGQYICKYIISIWKINVHFSYKNCYKIFNDEK